MSTEMLMTATACPLCGARLEVVRDGGRILADGTEARLAFAACPGCEFCTEIPANLDAKDNDLRFATDLAVAIFWEIARKTVEDLDTIANILRRIGFTISEPKEADWPFVSSHKWAASEAEAEPPFGSHAAIERAKATQSLWVTEFGTPYKVPDEIAHDPSLLDLSWHNDKEPSFGLAALGAYVTRGDAPDLRLWVGHPDPAERACDHGLSIDEVAARGLESVRPRFMVHDPDTGDEPFITEDPLAAVAVLRRRGSDRTVLLDAVVERLMWLGESARWDHTGGGILCVVIQEPAVEDAEWYFGTGDVKWLGTLARRSTSAEHPAGWEASTDVDSRSMDAQRIARAIKDAIDKARAKAGLHVQVSPEVRHS